MMPEFDYYSPQSLSEALQLLAAGAPGVQPISGGTNLVVDLRGGRYHPITVLNLQNLDELKGIQRENGALQAGGGVTIAELLRSDLVRLHGGSLCDAAGLFASPLVRNRATLAGNLVDASPAADTAPPLLALDAEVQLLSQAACRWVPLDEFFVGVRASVLRPDELLAAVRWPVPTDGTRFAYYKLGLRKADAISVVSLATAVELDLAGRISKARIALGSVAPQPLRSREAEEALLGQSLDEAVISKAAQLAASTARPISDLRASAEYRRQMVATLVRRLLFQTAAAFETKEEAHGA